jgi:hypothetical protein
MADWVNCITESSIVDKIVAVLLVCVLALPFLAAGFLILHG